VYVCPSVRRRSVRTVVRYAGEIAAENGGRLLTDKFLLVADERGDRIAQLDAETLTTRRLSIIVTSQPQVLVYDWLRRDLYWTSGRQPSAIFKYSLATEESSQLYGDRASGDRLL